jgi:hypothetical protein
MGRPLKIKISDTQDAGFNNPDGNGTPSGELYFGQVGGNSNLSSASFPTTTCRVKIGAVAEAEGYIIRQKGSTKYLVGDSTGVSDGSFIVGNNYIITSVGNTDWAAAGANPGFGVGSEFQATSVGGAGTGTADTIGTCVLANKADAALAANEMTVTYADPASTLTRIKRMTNKYAINFSNERVLVNYFNILDDTIEKSGADKDTMTGGVSTIDLVQIENPQYG